MVYCGTSINFDGNILKANFPLLKNSDIEILEWSYDAFQEKNTISTWFYDLLLEYSLADKLLGHGIFYSIFKAKWDHLQEDYLAHLTKLCRQFRFEHITEHFGFISGFDFHKGAPLPVPLNKTTLDIATDRINRLVHVCECPVGIENLAFAYHIEDVKIHGDFLEKIVAPINGFIILDLHNVYCQSKNFEIDLLELIQNYPLHLVREIHVSGGSWVESQLAIGKMIRRDTHDDKVPNEIFDVFPHILEKCPNLKFVILEQIGSSLANESFIENYQQDFFRIKKIVSSLNNLSPITNHFKPNLSSKINTELNDIDLYNDQTLIIKLFTEASSPMDAIEKLKFQPLHYDWQIEKWQADMIATCYDIIHKWK